MNHKNTMHRLLPALVLSAGLQSALAAPPAAAPRPAGTVLAAQFTALGDDAPARADSAHATAVAGKPAGSPPSTPREDERHPAGVLLAAFVLMSAIALRRWGAGQQ